MTTFRVLFDASPVFLLIAAGLLGLIIGSFLNVVIYRLPVMLERIWTRQCQEMTGTGALAGGKDEPFNLISPRSRCPHCGHSVSAMENIPVLSFLWLKGKCPACGHPISWRYPLVETLTACLTAVVAWRFGFTVAAAGALALTWALIALSFIDYDHQILPDAITLPLLWGGLAVNIFGMFATLQAAVIGAIAGYLFLWSVYHLFRLITGKEGMGHGDFKLFGALGAWLGWTSLPLIILLASVLGALVGLTNIVFRGRDRHLPIPFGPFLCAAGWVALLWGDTIIRHYLQLARLGG